MMFPDFEATKERLVVVDDGVLHDGTFHLPTDLYIPGVRVADHREEVSLMDELEEQIRANVQSYDKRMLDPYWRITNLYKIVDKKGEIVTFKPNVVQRALLKLFHPRMLVIKARQQGSSTFFAIIALDQCLFRSTFAAGLVADKKENAENIFKKIDFAWQHLDPNLKEILGLRCISDSKSILEFSNGSFCRVSSASIHSGTYQFLHISELGPLAKRSDEQARDLWKSAKPTVPLTGGFLVIESTAEGEGNFLSEFTDSVIENMERTLQLGNELAPTDFRLYFFPWFENPEYRLPVPKKYAFSKHHQEYFATVEKEVGAKIDDEQRMFYVSEERDLKDDVKTQYPSTLAEAFRSSGERLFRPEILEKKSRTEVIDPIETIGDLLIFKKFHHGHRYGIGADVGTGVSRDACAAAVIDFTTQEVVATYKSDKVKPEEFAYELAKIGNIYGGCIIAPEVNNVGHTTCVILNQIYPNVYLRVTQGEAEDRPTQKLGWHSNGQTKPKMMYEIVAAFEDDEAPLLVRDRTVLREAAKFRRSEVLYQAVTAHAVSKITRHFDLLIATAIAWQMRSHADEGHLIQSNQNNRIQEVRSAARAGKRRFN
jgi:hypothetical protein